MRRSDRLIQDQKEMEEIIKKSLVCRIAMTDGKIPYVVPMNFGYKDNCLYFHCAKQGKRLDMLKANSQVCFEMDVVMELKKAEIACDWGQKYESIIGFGKAVILEDKAEKKAALDILMEHYTGRTDFTYSEGHLNGVTVFKVEIESMTGKRCV